MSSAGRSSPRQGMVADVSYHGTGSENPHAHILLTMRRIEGQGFGKKVSGPGTARSGWKAGGSPGPSSTNRALDRAGRSERIDHRTLKEQRQEALDRGDLGESRCEAGPGAPGPPWQEPVHGGQEHQHGDGHPLPGDC